MNDKREEKKIEENDEENGRTNECFLIDEYFILEEEKEKERNK